jgi:hypothetical protein
MMGFWVRIVVFFYQRVVFHRSPCATAGMWPLLTHSVDASERVGTFV